MNPALDAKPIPLPMSRAGISDYVELLKLRLTSLVLVTTTVGFYLGHAGTMDSHFFTLLFHVVLGTAMVGGGAMVLNQVIERDTDARMERTMNRPIPSGRVGVLDALAFGMVIVSAGLLYLAVAVNIVACVLAFLTIASYLAGYTPLKMKTPLCTLVGAVPGAIPPMIGYVGATGRIDTRAWVLFTILFIWQMPHFMAIAWLYRQDYARGRQMMLPVIDPSGRSTSRQVLSFTLTLLPVTLMPTIIGMAGMTYFLGASVLGIVFLGFGVAMAMRQTDTSARRLFLVSLVYLPVLLSLMVWDAQVV